MAGSLFIILKILLATQLTGIGLIAGGGNLSRMYKVLVTGANGQLGSEIVERSIEHGYETVALNPLVGVLLKVSKNHSYKVYI